MTIADSAKQLFVSGLDCLDSGNFAQAEALFTKTLALLPNSIPTLSNLLICQFQQKKFAETIRTADRILAIDPDNIDAYHALALCHKELLQHELALADCENILRRVPNDSDALNNKGVILNSLGRQTEAIAPLCQAIAINPRAADAMVNRGNAYRFLKNFDSALADYDKALSIRADLASAWLGRGNVLADLKRHEDADAAFTKALAITPDNVAAWLGRGNVFAHLKRYEEALAAYDKALANNPSSQDALIGRGNVYADMKRYDEALASYDKLLSINSEHAEAWLGRGNALYDLKLHVDAFSAFDMALSIKADLAEAWLGRGNNFFVLKQQDAAIAAYDKALSIKPDLAESWLGRGNVFYELKRFSEAMAAYDKALSLKPDFAEAWLGQGNILADLKRHTEAVAAYDRALSIKPDAEAVEGARLYSKMHLCDWADLEEEIGNLIASIAAGKANCSPFVILSLSDSPADHLHCAQAWISAQHLAALKPTWQGNLYAHDKIRIGYVSADLRKHPVAFVMAELFELHDKERFSVTAFSLGLDDHSDIRQRLANSFDRFIDCHNVADRDIAHEIAKSEIDILIDLNGFTQDARTNIFAARPAPIQVNYLGYPGTMGAGYIDYIIGDNTLFLAGDEAAYSEKLVRLPDSYLPNDRKCLISAKRFTREEAGLPDSAFVFCCFNNNYKILPGTFDCWMRILTSIEGSVLWLRSGNQMSIANLRKEAANRGIDPARLVFADRMELLPEHLARLRLADLFLDTLPYNAHATAIDALWAGLPVLTRIGNAFAGRVAASLLKAIDLPELITHSDDEYEALAIELALNNDKLFAIREKLARNRLTKPLFDTPRYTKNLEAAYEQMYRRYQAGQPPDHIDFLPIGAV